MSHTGQLGAPSSSCAPFLRESPKPQLNLIFEDRLPFYTTTPQSPTEQANTLTLRNLIYFMLASDYLFLESSGRPTIRSTWERWDGQPPHPPKPMHSWWCNMYQQVDWKRWIKAAELIEMDRQGVVELVRPEKEELHLLRAGGSVVHEIDNPVPQAPPRYEPTMPRKSKCPFVRNRTIQAAKAQTFYDTYIIAPARALGIPVVTAEAYVYHSYYSAYRSSSRMDVRQRYADFDGCEIRERFLMDAEIVVPAVIRDLRLREKCIKMIDLAWDFRSDERDMAFEDRWDCRERVFELSRVPAAAKEQSAEPAGGIATAGRWRLGLGRKLQFAAAHMKVRLMDAYVRAMGGFEGSRYCGNGSGSGSQTTCRVAIRRSESGRTCIDPIGRREPLFVGVWF